MNAQQAIAYFVSMGWTPAQAAGIVANLMAESSLNPAAVGDGGAAYGIAQWHSDRQANFAAIIGKDIHGSSVEEQLAFVHAELNGSEKAAGDALRACLTASDAGACVSKRYERPADTQGEATRRAALAAKLAGEQPAAPIEDESVPATPVQSSGGGMPLLLSLLPMVLNLFAPRAQAAVQKITGQPSDIANQFVQSLFDKLQALTNTADPVQATATITKNPDPAVVTQLEDHALDYLDKIAPVMDKLAKADAQLNAAVLASQDAASARVDATNLRPMLARNVWLAIAVIAVLLGTAIILQVIMMSDHKPESDLIVAFTTMITYLLARLGDVYGYAFGGTQQSNRAGELAQQAAQKAINDGRT